MSKKNEEKKFKAKIFAFDFDGTLCESIWPGIGAPKQNMIDLAKKVKSEGHSIILWTCRTKERLQEAVDWCKEQGLEFDAVNEDIQRIKDLFQDDNGKKVMADYYIDDKAVTLDMVENGTFNY